MNRPDDSPNNSIIIYTTEDGLTKIDTTFDGDTVWLSIDQMADLFQRDKSTISRHIKNIFAEGELDRDAVVAKFATTAADGKTYQVEFFNLWCMSVNSHPIRFDILIHFRVKIIHFRPSSGSRSS